MQNKLTVAKKAMWVVCCQTGVASNFVFWTFSYVVVIGLACYHKNQKCVDLKNKHPKDS
jgi:hypothetical protein